MVDVNTMVDVTPKQRLAPSIDIMAAQSWAGLVSTNVPEQHALSRRVCHVFVTSTKTPPCEDRDQCVATLRSMQEWKVRDRRGMDLMYNFMVGGDGRVYEGRGLALQPYLPNFAARRYQAKSCLFGVIGNYHSRQDIPPAAVQLIYKVVRYGMNMGLFETYCDLKYIERDGFDRKTKKRDVIFK